MDFKLNTVIIAMSLPMTAANTYHPLMSYTGQKCLQDTERRRAGDADLLCVRRIYEHGVSTTRPAFSN